MVSKSKIAARQKVIFGLCHSSLMDLYQDQQQHLTVHSGGISGGGSVAVAVGVSDM